MTPDTHHSCDNHAAPLLAFPLCKCVEGALKNYFAHLDGGMPANLYQMVLEQVEIPLLRNIMHHVDNNQSKAATVLGISRVTLRKKLKQYGL